MSDTPANYTDAKPGAIPYSMLSPLSGSVSLQVDDDTANAASCLLLASRQPHPFYEFTLHYGNDLNSRSP